MSVEHNYNMKVSWVHDRQGSKIRIMRQIATIMFLATFLLVASCGSNGNTAGAQVAGPQIKSKVSVDDFEKKKSTISNVQLIDVRTPEEFADGHLENALNIDINGDSFDADVAKMDKTRPVLVYCRSGGRSSSAAEKLKDKGFKEVYDLSGGITAWKGAGKAVTTVSPAPGK